jgi:WD40 repeat protein
VAFNPRDTVYAFCRYDPATGREKLAAKLPTPSPYAAPQLSASGRRFVYADGDGVVCIGDADTGSVLHRLEDLGNLQNDTGWGSPFALSPDDRTLAVAVGEDTIALYDVTTRAKTASLQRANAAYTGVVFAADGLTLACLHNRDEVARRRGGVRRADSGDPPSEVHLWDVATKAYRCQLQPDALPAPFNSCRVAFSPDGKMLVTMRGALAPGGLVPPILWDATTGRELRRLTSVAEWLHAIDFAPDGKTLVGGTDGGTVILWDMTTGRLLPASADPAAKTTQLYYADGGRQLISRADRFTAWDVSTGRAVGHFPPASAVPSLAALAPYPDETALSPDYRLVAGAVVKDGRQQVVVWDAATGQEVRPMEVSKPDEQHRYQSIMFTPDGCRVLAAETIDKIVIWDVNTGRTPATLSADGRSIDGTSVVVSPNGRWLAAGIRANVGDFDSDLGVWDLTTFKQVLRFPGTGGKVAFAADGRWLASVTNGEVRLLDIETRHTLRKWPATAGSPVAISADGRTLATGGTNSTLRLWETATGGERHRFAGHAGRIFAIAYAPDGRTLATSSYDAPVYIWDVLNLADFAGRAPTAAELDQAWAALAGADANAAFQMIRRLVAAPNLSVAFLRERLKPAAAADAQHVHELVRQLDGERFPERQRATQELEKLGDGAVAELRAALKQPTSAEARQTLQRLLDWIESDTPETLRTIRAVEALEYIATPEAREHLKALAGGAAGAALTDAAAAALKRLVNISARSN